MCQDKSGTFNILSNAVKFTDKGKIKLDIDSRYINDDVVELSFAISDTGIGIRDEDMDKLFNQFSQVDAMRNRKREGTGLGLALAKNIVQMMNGSIEVQSEYNVGSCFTAKIRQRVCEEQNTVLKNMPLKNIRIKLYLYMKMITVAESICLKFSNSLVRIQFVSIP